MIDNVNDKMGSGGCLFNNVLNTIPEQQRVCRDGLCHVHRSCFAIESNPSHTCSLRALAQPDAKVWQLLGHDKLNQFWTYKNKINWFFSVKFYVAFPMFQCILKDENLYNFISKLCLNHIYFRDDLRFSILHVVLWLFLLRPEDERKLWMWKENLISCKYFILAYI
jgi:hypothetical protein